MKAKTTATFLILFLIGISTHSQNILIRQQDSASMIYQAYFDGIHQNAKKSAAQISQSNYAYVIVTLGQNLKMKNYEVVEIPGLPFTAFAKKYVKSLLESADGRWDITASEKIRNDKFMFSVAIIKMDQNLNERGDAGAKMFEYGLLYLSAKQTAEGITPGSEVPLTLTF